VLFGNGDFETGDLTAWDGAGDVGVANENVISGSYSAYLTTAGSLDDGSPLSGSPAVNDMCSFLWSGVFYPAASPQAVLVNFKVRYKTNEGIGPYAIEDPFTAELVTGQGTVDLVTIKADGITPGPGTTVMNLSTGLQIPPPPTVPPVAVVEGLYFMETPTLAVSSRIPYGSCDPVFIKFMICDFLFIDFDSAAFVDDVSITTVGGGGGGGPGGGAPALCPPIIAKPVPAWLRGK
jgi:hypothetical protein